MNQDQWTAVDRYFGQAVLPADPGLQAALDASARAGLPAINVSPLQGKWLHVMALIQGARRILEIGTLGGYSTIWLARALPPDGLLVTLEAEPRHAEVAQRNVDAAGCGRRVRIVVGKALETLPRMQKEFPEPFDLIFIDADKVGTSEYFAWALKLSRPGSVIIVDNVVRKGAVLDAGSDDPAAQGMRRFIEGLAREPRVAASAIQTVGTKGYDGFVLARVIA